MLMLLLNDAAKSRLSDAIRAVLAVPFVDDIEDFIWEAILMDFRIRDDRYRIAE
jgi:hypothetical protein